MLLLDSRESVEPALWIEGMSNEVATSAAILFIFFVWYLVHVVKTRVFGRSSVLHPDSEDNVSVTRTQLERNHRQQRTQAANHDENCTICLGTMEYALETNCAHLFCGTCIITYWRTGRWLGAVQCPCCRQTVTVLLTSFTANEIQENNSAVKNQVLHDVHEYNRRFSGEPRTVWEYIQDLPTMLRHAFSDLFTLDGMVFMFRIRIVICVIFAFLYLISPLDLIPDVAIGFLGFVDDLFIIFMVAVYISMIYRGMLAARGAQAGAHTHID